MNRLEYIELLPLKLCLIYTAESVWVSLGQLSVSRVAMLLLFFAYRICMQLADADALPRSKERL